MLLTLRPHKVLPSQWLLKDFWVEPYTLYCFFKVLISNCEAAISNTIIQRLKALIYKDLVSKMCRQNSPTTKISLWSQYSFGISIGRKDERMPLDRKQRDLIFQEMLTGFTFQKLYYMAVRIFGSLYSRFF